jgi:hypothetical protein
MANLSNINNKFLFTDGDFLKIGNLAPINNISGTESGISITNSNVASITLDNTAASGKRYIMYSSGNGSLVFWDGDAGSARLQIDSAGNSTFGGDVTLGSWLKGSSGTNAFYSATSYGTLLNSPTNSGAGANIYFRNSTGTVFQTFSQSDGSATFAGMITVNGGGIDIDNNDDVRLRFDNASVFKAGLQVATTAGDMIAGSAINDFAIRAQENMLFSTGGNTERMRITSGGILKVGGTDAGYSSTLIHTGNYSATQSGINILSSSTGYGYLLFGDGDGAASYTGQITYKHGDEFMAFNTNGAERIRIDSSGVISIGPSTTSSEIYFNYNNTNNKGGLKIDYSTGELRLTVGESGNGYHQAFWTNGSEKMRIDSSGDVGIGTTSPSDFDSVGADNLVVGPGTGNNGITVYSATTGYGALAFADGNTSASVDQYRGLIQYNHTSDTLALFTNATTKMTILSGGNVGIGVTSPTSKLDVTNGEGKFCVDSKVHLLTNAFTTCLTVNLNSHTGCYVTLTCFGDWGGHSSAAYRGEFFLQNGANAYSEPGIILRQDDNTSNGTDQIVCQILDPTSGANPKDFEIQIRTTATSGTTSFSGQLTYTVQGKFNSIT